MSLTDLSLSEAASLIARREISPVELTRACLERIERLDPLLNCFITLTAESATRQAQEAESYLSTCLPDTCLPDTCLPDTSLPPLLGIPLALKDLYETADAPTTAGSKFDLTTPLLSPHRRPSESLAIPDVEGRRWGDVRGVDAHAVQKLRAAGAVLLGKLNLHEIALGVTNENPHFGPCRNPWDVTRITGGSSGGSAAALAAGLIFGSLGSDTGGSIRIPAALCGVVGLKPTFGRVSLRGVVPLSWNCDHAGPMARTVRDVAILLQTIAGYDPDDPYSANVPVDDYLSELEGGVRGWRVALACDDYFAEADPEVLAAVRAAAGVFAQLGAVVAEVELPGACDAAKANVRMVTSDAAAFHRERMETRPEDFGIDVLERLRNGASYSAVEYSLFRRTQTLMRRQYEQFFDDYDLLLTPATPMAAPLIGDASAVLRARQLTRFTAPFNLTGLPAISLPCGFTTGGLPIGLQIVSRPWAEAALLRAAYAYEQATEWHSRKPPVIRET